MKTHQLTLMTGAVTYRMRVYYFAGNKVDSELHNHSRTNLTFDLADLVVTARKGSIARPCLVWRDATDASGVDPARYRDKGRPARRTPAWPMNGLPGDMPNGFLPVGFYMQARATTEKLEPWHDQRVSPPRTRIQPLADAGRLACTPCLGVCLPRFGAGWAVDARRPRRPRGDFRARAEPVVSIDTRGEPIVGLKIMARSTLAPKKRSRSRTKLSRPSAAAQGAGHSDGHYATIARCSFRADERR